MTTTMDVAATMDALAAATGMTNTFAYPVDDAVPPCAIVGYPIDEMDIHKTFGVANASGVFPVWIVFGDVMEKETRDLISSTMTTVIAGIDAASLVVSVRNAKFERVFLGGIPKMAVRLDCEVDS